MNLMTKDQLRIQINSIIKSSCKTGNFAESYYKVYKAYNSFGFHKVNLKKDKNTIMQEIYDADRMEELYYITRRVILRELNMPIELVTKINTYNEKVKKIISQDKEPINLDDLVRPATVDDIKAIFKNSY